MSNMDNFSADELLKRLKENVGEGIKAGDKPETGSVGKLEETAKEDMSARDVAGTVYVKKKYKMAKRAAREVTPPSAKSPEKILPTPEQTEKPLEADKAEALGKTADHSDETISFDVPSVTEEDLQFDDKPTEEFSAVSDSVIDDFDAPAADMTDEGGLEAPDMEAFAAAAKDESDNVLDFAEEGAKFDPADIGIAIAVEGMDKAKKRFGEDKVREAINMLNISDDELTNDEEESKGEYAEPGGVFLEGEYERHEQNPEIFGKYKGEKSRIRLRLFGSAVLAICLLIFENLHLLGVNLPGAFNAIEYPAVHVFVSLQLLVLAAALSYKEMISGVRKMAHFVFDSNTVAVFAVGVTALCDLLIAFFANGGEFRIYNFAAVAVLVFCAFHDYLDIRREMYSFEVVSSKKPKYAVTAEAHIKEAEQDSLFGRPDENSDIILNVKKVGFIGKYFERTAAKSDSDKYTPYFVFGALAVSIILAVISGVNAKNAAAAFATANLTALMCLPVSAFFAPCLPLFLASKRARENDSAIIGEASVDEYSGASTIVFDDKDIFPANSVKVKGIKMYEDAPIDEMLCNIAGVYSKLGGPLYDVLSRVTAEIGTCGEVELLECTDGGVSAKLGSERCVLIGNSAYMEQNDIFPVYDYEDEIQMAGGNIRIMYVAYDGKLASKMYIQYAIDPDFDGMLRKIYKNAMNVIIKTMDPNIDNTLLVGRTRPANYPAKIERRPMEEAGTHTVSYAESGIVSRANTKSLISTVLLCDKLRHVKFTGNIVKIMSVIVALINMMIFTISGSPMLILSVFVALYHLFWMLPVFAVSKLYLN